MVYVLVVFCHFTIVFYSDYNRSGLDPSEQYKDAKAGPLVYKAMWQLSVALLIKAILTIFTFGMKVTTY